MLSAARCEFCAGDGGTQRRRPGDPADWPVITASAEWNYWDRFDGTVCEFLVEVAAGDMTPAALPMGRSFR